MKAVGKIAIKEEQLGVNGFGSVLTAEETVYFDGDFYNEDMFPKYGVQITLPNNIVITVSKYVFDKQSYADCYAATIQLQQRIYEVIVNDEEETTVNVYDNNGYYDDDTPSKRYSTKNDTILAVMRL